ncbi:MAG: UvrD-helicase domain-containing protein [Thiobacillaceae bacterium]
MPSPLNLPQREAARYIDGPLLVLAGAGSGKTRVITHKIAWLIGECGYKPASIAAITFTNKAAREMQDRTAKLLERQAGNGLVVTTFHSLGVRLLREEAGFVGLKPGFSILDSADAHGIIAEILQTTDRKLVRQVAGRISKWKNDLCSPGAARATAENDADHAWAKLYDRYAATLSAYQAVDFDDLIRLPAELLQAHAEVRNKWQNRMRHVLVDEYQDTNAAQYQVLKLLTGPRAAFTVVGDNDQSIYGWRGASVDNLNALSADFPHLKVIKLEQNYRSTTRILKAANTLIANNLRPYEKKLWSDLGLGDAIQVVSAKDDVAEAESVVMRLMNHKFQHRTHYRDYAILYRGNHQARVFEQALRNEKIPYRLSGGQSFFDKAEIKDIIAWLRLIANQNDDPAFIRAVTTPKRGIGTTTLAHLGEAAARNRTSLFEAAYSVSITQHLAPRQLESLTEFCDFINRISYRAAREPALQVLDDLMAAIGYEAHLRDTEEPRTAEVKGKNVQDFVNWLKNKGETDKKDMLELTQTVAIITLLDDQDDSEVDAIKLSTLHAAKGLEYDHVFLVGVEENLLPHREAVEENRLEEERRLMYVGITRARKSLTLTHCERRKRGGDWAGCEASRFISEMGEEIRRPQANPDAKESGKARLALLRSMLAES